MSFFPHRSSVWMSLVGTLRAGRDHCAKVCQAVCGGRRKKRYALLLKLLFLINTLFMGNKSQWIRCVGEVCTVLSSCIWEFDPSPHPDPVESACPPQWCFISYSYSSCFSISPLFTLPPLFWHLRVNMKRPIVESACFIRRVSRSLTRSVLTQCVWSVVSQAPSHSWPGKGAEPWGKCSSASQITHSWSASNSESTSDCL